jgi:cytochrome c peroxidase
MQERSVRPRVRRREPPRSASTFWSRRQRVHAPGHRRALRSAACLSLTVIAAWASSAEGEAASNEAKAPASGGSNHGALAMGEQQQTLATLIGPVKAVSAPAGVNAEFWQSLVPKDNPGTEAQVALGRKLYFDTRLSKDGSVACATCHDVSRGFSDHRNTSEGIGDQIGRRNAPPTMNAAFFETQFWDGRAASLEDQAKLPIINPIEMGMPDGKAAAAAIASDAGYQAAFQAAYGRQPNYEDIGRALAAFERTLIFLSAPFDDFLRGDVDAISADARAGFALFNGKARCNACHQMSSSRPLGTDNRFHNIGVSARHQNFEELAQRGLAAIAKDDSIESIDRLALETDLAELGRFVVSRSRADVGAFKTSQVRNVGVTAPYMHDGTLQTLWDVVDHYNKGGEANPYLDGGIEPLALTEKEVDQVVAFLFSLTDERLAKQNEAEFSRQRAVAAERRPFRDTRLTQREVLPFERLLKGRSQ